MQGTLTLSQSTQSGKFRLEADLSPDLARAVVSLILTPSSANGTVHGTAPDTQHVPPAKTGQKRKRGRPRTTGTDAVPFTCKWCSSHGVGKVGRRFCSQRCAS